MSDPAIPN